MLCCDALCIVAGAHIYNEPICSVCVCVLICIYTHTSVCVCIFVYHTHIYVRIYMYTHMYILDLLPCMSFFVRILITCICEVLIYRIGAGFPSRLKIILWSGLVYVDRYSDDFLLLFFSFVYVLNSAV